MRFFQDPLGPITNLLFLRFKAQALETGLGLNSDSSVAPVCREL